MVLKRVIDKSSAKAKGGARPPAVDTRSLPPVVGISFASLEESLVEELSAENIRAMREKLRFDIERWATDKLARDDFLSLAHGMQELGIDVSKEVKSAKELIEDKQRVVYQVELGANPLPVIRHQLELNSLDDKGMGLRNPERIMKKVKGLARRRLYWDFIPKAADLKKQGIVDPEMIELFIQNGELDTQLSVTADRRDWEAYAEIAASCKLFGIDVNDRVLFSRAGGRISVSGAELRGGLVELTKQAKDTHDWRRVVRHASNLNDLGLLTPNTKPEQKVA